MLLLFEPVSFAEAMLKMLLILFVLGILVALAGYYGLKYFAKYLNRRRDTWEDTARQLGVEIQREYNQIVKPLKGIYQDCNVKISHEHIPRGKNSYDSYTICEAYLPTALPFPLEIKSEGYFTQALASVFRNKEVKVGVPGFDNSFFVDCPEGEAIQNLLSVYLPDGKAPNLIADLLSIKKSSYQLKITDELVYLKNDGEYLEASDIEPMLNSAVYLVKRIQAAREKLAKDLGESPLWFSAN